MSHTHHHSRKQHERSFNQAGSHLRGKAWVIANNRSGAFLAGYNDAIAGRPDPLNGLGRTYDEQRRYERGRLTAAAIQATKPLTKLTLREHAVAVAVVKDTVGFGR